MEVRGLGKKLDDTESVGFNSSYSKHSVLVRQKWVKNRDFYANYLIAIFLVLAVFRKKAVFNNVPLLGS